jgi:hypothetical protein
MEVAQSLSIQGFMEELNLLDGKHPLGSVISSRISIKIWYKSYRNALQRDVASAKMNCSVRKESGLKK